METRVQDEYIDRSLGFPVKIRDAPMRKFRGDWILDVEPNLLETRVLWQLVTGEEPLTGNHIRFIRHWLEETQQQFGEPLEVSGAAVSKWEGRTDQPTGMKKSTEFQIRMRVARELLDQPDSPTSADFRDVYDQTSRFDPDRAPHPIVIEHEQRRPPEETGTSG